MFKKIFCYIYCISSHEICCVLVDGEGFDSSNVANIASLIGEMYECVRYDQFGYGKSRMLDDYGGEITEQRVLDAERILRAHSALTGNALRCATLNHIRSGLSNRITLGTAAYDLALVIKFIKNQSPYQRIVLIGFSHVVDSVLELGRLVKTSPYQRIVLIGFSHVVDSVLELGRLVKTSPYQRIVLIGFSHVVDSVLELGRLVKTSPWNPYECLLNDLIGGRIRIFLYR